MSRSHKKNPFCKIAGESDKQDKRLANRKFRRKAKVKINNNEEPPIDLNEVSDTWAFSSDGLSHYMQAANSNKEEDVELVKRLMRK